MLGGQTRHDPCEDAFLAPTRPSAVKPFVRPVSFRGISPAQTIAIDEDNPSQHPCVINPRLAVRLREKWDKLRHLRVGSPIMIAHLSAPFWEP